MSDILPFSAACERNKDVILGQLSPYLKQCDSILEVGSGTAQHAVHFAKAHPGLKWQTSDQCEYLEGIKLQLKYANVANVLPPIELNVNQPTWHPDGIRYPAVYTANTLHIMSWDDVQAFLMGLGEVTLPNAHVFIYGPFKYDGKFTSQSNYEFDQSLRSRGVGSAIRDFESVNQCANKFGFQLHSDIAMPANNQLLIWTKK